jgi:hypothetical protein
MSAKTYLDRWTCPKGHANSTIRRVASAGRKVSTTCTHRDCQWKKYPVIAGPVKESA